MNWNELKWIEINWNESKWIETSWNELKWTEMKMCIAPQEREDMRSMFRVCATERLFVPDMFPDIDKAIYVDTDLIFLRFVDAWNDALSGHWHCLVFLTH